MNSREDFESKLDRLASLAIGTAAGELEESDIDLIRRAAGDLKADPSLFSGDEDGAFSYNHPLLALAAGEYQRHGELAVGVASDGDELRGANLLGWIITGVRNWKARAHDPDRARLRDRHPAAPIVSTKPALRIAVVGDAGYAGAAQRTVLRRILARHEQAPFDLAIHLGDVYFTGTMVEMDRNFLEPFAALGRAGLPVFSLCGNHDLYDGSAPYLHVLDELKQPGRYFAIEAPDWRIACLDTSTAPEAARLLHDDGWLDRLQEEWLHELGRDGKPLILMSHHYILSNWGKPAPTLFAQLSDWAKRHVTAWYWGHEHHQAAYGPDPHGFHGACVGNGAFLEHWSSASLDRPTPPTWHADRGCLCYEDRGLNRWPHGFLELELTAGRLDEKYHAENAMVYQRAVLARFPHDQG